MRLGIAMIDQEKKENAFINLIVKDFRETKKEEIEDYYNKGTKINTRKIFKYKNFSLTAYYHEISVSYSVIGMPKFNYLTATQIKDLSILNYFNKIQKITQIADERLEKLFSKEIATGHKNDDSPEKIASNIIKIEMAVLSQI